MCEADCIEDFTLIKLTNAGEGLQLDETSTTSCCVVFHSKALWTVSWLCRCHFNMECKDSRPYCLSWSRLS